VSLNFCISRKKGSGPRHPYAMNEVTLRAGQSTFDTSGGKLGQGAPSHRMSRMSLEAIRSTRIVVEQNLARKVRGGNPDDFDLLCHTAKRSSTDTQSVLRCILLSPGLAMGDQLCSCSSLPAILVLRLSPLPHRFYRLCRRHMQNR
jgi:hypothetical protein